MHLALLSLEGLRVELFKPVETIVLAVYNAIIELGMKKSPSDVI